MPGDSEREQSMQKAIGQGSSWPFSHFSVERNNFGKTRGNININEQLSHFYFKEQ